MTNSALSWSRASRGLLLEVVVSVCVAAICYGQSSAGQRSGTQRSAGQSKSEPGQNKVPRKQTPRDPATPAAPGPTGHEQSQAPQVAAAPPDPTTFPEEQVKAGQALFAAQCGFCHGRDAGGGEGGPDLTASLLVAQDIRGEKIGPVVRSGRMDKGMPAFELANEPMMAIVAFIHDRKAKAKEGRRRTVDFSDLQTGNAEAGKQYFNGAGGCAKCHSPSGDLAGVATRYKGLELLRRMLYPGGRRAPGTTGPVAVTTATVTLPSGATVTGRLAYRDEFTIGLIDSSGWYRSWPTSQVKSTVMNPLDAHGEQLGKYSDADMHNVLAYLQTLR